MTTRVITDAIISSTSVKPLSEVRVPMLVMPQATAEIYDVSVYFCVVAPAG